MLGIPSAGRLYGSDVSVKDVHFDTTAGFMVGTRSVAEGQP